MRIQNVFFAAIRLCLSWCVVLLTLPGQAAEATSPQVSEAASAQASKPVVMKPKAVAAGKPGAQAIKAKAVSKPAMVNQANKAVPVAWPSKSRAVVGKVGASSTPVLTKPVHIVPATKPADLAAMVTPQDFCAQAMRAMPSVELPLCARAQLTPTTGRSVWGRAIFQRDVIAPTPQLRVLVIGGIHGDERSSSALVLHWIQHALQTPANVHWRFVPLVNPDGLLMTPSRRTNANGVDLNRNFPTPRWDKEAPVYWANRTKSDPRRYPGPRPLSEPESRWVHDEMERWKPNLIVSVHAPYAVLDFDGPAVPPQRLGRLYLDQVGIYPGSLGNFGGIHKRVPVVTIELPSASAMPSEAETRQMWLDLLRWMGERLGAG
jgi:hypothetical protein